MAERKPAFDPDAYLAEKNAGAFNPDEYLSESGIEAPQEKERPLGREAIEFLPALSSMGAGAAGGLIGGLPGVALGAASGLGGYLLGTGAKEGIKHYVYDEPTTIEKFATETLPEAAKEGAISEALGVATLGVSKLAKGAMKPLATELSKTPKKVVETYQKHMKEVDALAKKYGGEFIEAADDLRRSISKRIEGFRSIQNKQISDALAKSTATVPSQPMVDSLLKWKSKLDPDVNVEMIAKIDDELSLISRVANEAGEIPVARANALKMKWQKAADYTPEGVRKVRKDPVDVAMKSVAHKTTGLINKVAPEVKAANDKLANIHRIESGMNRNLVKEGAPDASIYGAGAGNERNARYLRRMGEATGADFLGDAEKLAAAKYLGDAPIMPFSETGARMAPIMLGGIGGLGAGANALLGGGDLEEALSQGGKGLLLGSLASPKALKLGLKAGNKLRRVPISQSAGRGAGLLLQSGDE